MIRPVFCRFAAIEALVLFWAGTGIAQGPSSVLERYRFDQPPSLHQELPEELDEISGLALSADGHLYAHEDERAFVYEIDPSSGEAISRFYLGQRGTRGDFEGLAIAGDRFFLVDSDGNLFEFAVGEPDAEVPYERIRTRLGARCEVEGLAFDEPTNALLLACKTPRQRDLRGQIAIFAFSLDRMTLEEEPRIRIPVGALPDFDEDDEISPSAVEVHHATGHLILAAAQQRLLLEFAPDGRPVGVRELESSLHRQSEGLTFALDGSLLVADEADGEEATLSRYPTSEN